MSKEYTSESTSSIASYDDAVKALSITKNQKLDGDNVFVVDVIESALSNAKWLSGCEQHADRITLDDGLIKELSNYTNMIAGIDTPEKVAALALIALTQVLRERHASFTFFKDDVEYSFRASSDMVARRLPKLESRLLKEGGK